MPRASSNNLIDYTITTSASLHSYGTVSTGGGGGSLDRPIYTYTNGGLSSQIVYSDNTSYIYNYAIDYNNISNDYSYVTMKFPHEWDECLEKPKKKKIIYQEEMEI